MANRKSQKLKSNLFCTSSQVGRKLIHVACGQFCGVYPGFLRCCRPSLKVSWSLQYSNSISVVYSFWESSFHGLPQVVGLVPTTCSHHSCSASGDVPGQGHIWKILVILSQVTFGFSFEKCIHSTLRIKPLSFGGWIQVVHHSNIIYTKNSCRWVTALFTNFRMFLSAI